MGLSLRLDVVVEDQMLGIVVAKERHSAKPQKIGGRECVEAAGLWALLGNSF